MNRIEQILADLRYPCRTGEVVNAPQLWRVELIPTRRQLKNGLGDKTRPVHLRQRAESIALDLGVPSVTISQDTKLWLEIPKAQPDIVYARDIKPSRGASLPLCLGVDVMGKVAQIDLAEPGTCHVLVAGMTGSGKTELLHGMLYNIIRYVHPERVKIVAIDTNASLKAWEGTPHFFAPCVTNAGHALEMMGTVMTIIRNRYDKGWDGVTRWLVVVDELADLTLNPHYGDEIEDTITEALQIGRKVGISFVLSTQRPSVDVVKGLLKVNCPARIAMALPSVVDSKTILDRKGAELLTGRGDALLAVNGKVTRFQAAYVTESDMWELRQRVTAWQGAQKRNLRKLVTSSKKGLKIRCETREEVPWYLKVFAR